MQHDKPPRWVQLSRFMALILRHRADEFGVNLDAEGYADVDELIRAMRSSPHWTQITREDILEVIRRQEKPRFELNQNRVRALYGHSLPQRIQYQEIEPPEFLFHGTSPASLDRIRVEGLLPMERQYVHLSGTPDDAYQVGRRRSQHPVILRIRAREAQQADIHFYQAEEHIYLVRRVPRQFIEEMLNDER
ncbi:MAG: RNA 2'-phosphotransferase [Acidobacteria bacterium]|nr:RNA 2'-phosphotransferase [Acidobacteriota bacterium]